MGRFREVARSRHESEFLVLPRRIVAVIHAPILAFFRVRSIHLGRIDLLIGVRIVLNTAVRD
ncbi:MAG: hypothetical protein OXC92_06705 [Flavobacteriaceae bacterium]|nr:hypothetical protein [Flavobacteriaceae bacterium]MCY4267559.1 hypothetical protein [Flavobacteriaceae bacterium]MCY4299347.1 hypothetical protein [Flavobacteriaceae bacterium]